MEHEDGTGAGRRRVLVGLGALVAVLAVAVAGLRVTGEDEAPTPSTTTTSTSTTVPPSTTTIPTAELDAAVFPDRAAGAGYADPRELARAYAERLGFLDPIVGVFTQGDARSGEVALRVTESGPPSVVLVRQLGDDRWYALGVVGEPIRLDTPAAGARLTAPQPLAGAAYAFEGTVSVALYVDGNDEPIAETVVTGRGDGTLGDFTGSIDFTVPAGATRGTLVLRDLGGEGGTVSASVVRIRF